MPELPEVETYRKYLEATSLHQQITGFSAVDPQRQVTMPYEDFQQQLKGRTMVATKRIGKHLLVILDNGQVLSLHFGMTGGLHYYRLPEDEPRFERAVFYLDSGFKLAFTDSRKFGRIGLWDNETVYQNAKKLGPDALHMPESTFAENLLKRKIALKGALLDQQVLAGIGNWLADEILFQAKLHPEKIAATLTLPEIHVLWQVTQEVLQTSIQQEAIYRELPDTYLIHAREWDASPFPGKNDHQYCPNCRAEILKIVVGGRATYLCPICQPRPFQP